MKNEKEESFAALFRRTLAERTDAGDREAMGLAAGEEALPEGLRRDEAVAVSVVRKALRGDVAAVKFLCDAVREMDAASPQSGACEADDEQGPRPFRLVLEVVDGAEGGSL